MLISNISSYSCYLVQCSFPKQKMFSFWVTPSYFILGIRKLQFSWFLIFFLVDACFCFLFSISCSHLHLCIFNLWPITAELFYFNFTRLFFILNFILQENLDKVFKNWRSFWNQWLKEAVPIFQGWIFRYLRTEFFNS